MDLVRVEKGAPGDRARSITPWHRCYREHVIQRETLTLKRLPRSLGALPNMQLACEATENIYTSMRVYPYMYIFFS